jgi:autotransporter-associated beta strand protein
MSFVSGSILTARATLLGGGPLNVDTTNVTFPTTGTMIFNQDSTSSGAATTGIVVTGDYPTLTGNLTIQLGAGTSANATGPLTLNGAISDGGFGYALNKTSPNGASLGTLILNGTNTYYGNTTVTAGGLIIGGSGALGVTASSTNYAGNIILTAASSSLTNATTATQLWSGQISGAGKLTQSGPGMLTLDNSETYTGETAINGGTLALGPSGSITSSKISIAAGATFDVSQPNGGSYTFSGTTFSARGASSPAILNGASGGSINFGSATIALVYDATNRPLTIAWSAGTAGTLTLNNNPFTVSNTGPALVQGSYPLFQLPPGTTIVPSSGIFPASVTGNGLANGTDEGVVVVNAGTVVLVVQTSHHNSEVWNGADFNNSPNWSDGANWVSGVPPTNGDILTFSGATGLSPVMDNSYNITSLTFDTNATNSFVLNNNGSGTLSISGGVSNNSTFAQTLGMPVALVGVVSAWSIPNSNASITLNGPLSDSGNGFTLTGQGPLTLAGNNTFTGGMTDGTNSTLQVTGDLGDTGGGSGSYAGAITDNGTLIFANSSQQTLSGPIADNGVLIFNSFASDTVSGQISGTGSLTQMGVNTVTLGNAANNYAGGTTITGGTVSISADSALGTGPLTFDNGGRLLMTGSTITDNRLITVQSGGGVMSQSGPTVTLNGPLTGPGTLSVSGNDFILAPTGTNTLGSLHETGGNRVFVSTAGALGAGTNLTSINMAGITGSVLDFQNSAPTNPQNAMVFGSGSSLTARNNGGYPGLTVSTTNVTFPTSGTMVFNRDSGAAGTATQPIVINGDYPMLTGPLTIALGGGTGTAVTGPVTLNGAINDGGSGFGLTVSSANVNSLGSLTLNGTNGYTGDTILNFGSLTIGTNGDLGDTGPGNGGLYAGAITINGSLNNAASVNQTWSGQITGPGSLTQNGTGTLYLDGANTYSGATLVNAGLLGGTGTIAGDVTVNSGGGLAPGNSIGTLTINGNLTFNAGSLNVFEVNGSTPANDSVIAGASVTYGGALKIVPTGSFTVGQQFVLFSGAGATNASNFASIQSTGLNFGFTNGVLTLLSTSATNPTNILFHVSGNTLTLSWPSDHLGWTLYSNSVSLRATNQWFPLAGSSSVISTNLPINHSQANVFFRLQEH